MRDHIAYGIPGSQSVTILRTITRKEQNTGTVAHLAGAGYLPGTGPRDTEISNHRHEGVDGHVSDLHSRITGDYFQALQALKSIPLMKMGSRI